MKNFNLEDSCVRMGSLDTATCMHQNCQSTVFFASDPLICDIKSLSEFVYGINYDEIDTENWYWVAVADDDENTWNPCREEALADRLNYLTIPSPIWEEMCDFIEEKKTNNISIGRDNYHWTLSLDNVEICRWNDKDYYWWYEDEGFEFVEMEYNQNK
jgi:hypothetical protein